MIDVTVVAVTEQPEVVVHEAVVVVVIKFPLSSKINVVVVVQSVTVAIIQDEDDSSVDLNNSEYVGLPSPVYCLLWALRSLTPGPPRGHTRRG